MLVLQKITVFALTFSSLGVNTGEQRSHFSGFSAWIAVQPESSVKTSEPFDHDMAISTSLQSKRESRFSFKSTETEIESLLEGCMGYFSVSVNLSLR